MHCELLGFSEARCLVLLGCWHRTCKYPIRPQEAAHTTPLSQALWFARGPFYFSSTNRIPLPAMPAALSFCAYAYASVSASALTARMKRLMSKTSPAKLNLSIVSPRLRLESPLLNAVNQKGSVEVSGLSQFFVNSSE